MDRRGRGQLVLVVAAVVAAALAPALLAYLQLGYHADADVSAAFVDSTANAVRVLDWATFTARTTVAGEYASTERGRAADRVRTSVHPRIDRLAGSRGVAGTATLVTYNGSAAARTAATACPAGPNRAFGPCRADGDGVL